MKILLTLLRRAFSPNLFLNLTQSYKFLPAAAGLLRSVDLWIEGCMKYRAFMLRCRACFPSPSERRATTHVPRNLHLSVHLTIFFLVLIFSGQVSLEGLSIFCQQVSKSQNSQNICCLKVKLSRVQLKASVLMQRLSYPTETVLSNNIARNRIVLSFKDSPRKPLGRRP